MRKLSFNRQVYVILRLLFLIQIVNDQLGSFMINFWIFILAFKCCYLLVNYMRIRRLWVILPISINKLIIFISISKNKFLLLWHGHGLRFTCFFFCLLNDCFLFLFKSHIILGSFSYFNRLVFLLLCFTNLLGCNWLFISRWNRDRLRLFGI